MIPYGLSFEKLCVAVLSKFSGLNILLPPEPHAVEDWWDCSGILPIIVWRYL